jgi:hypothetical protein
MNDATPVVTLVTKTAQRSEGVIAALENMLAIAKTEGLTGIAIAGVDAEGGVHSAYEAGENLATLIGGADYIKYRLLKHLAGD